MSLPGLEQLAAIHPGFAAEAKHLGEAAWQAQDRTPRETAACFVGLDLAHGLLDLPLRLHTEMARQLGVTGGYLGNVLVALAPVAGYPCVAQALVNIADLLTAPGTGDDLTAREKDFAVTAWAVTTGTATRGLPTQSLVEEYGRAPAR
jgi:alkylhydroperoxidase/carboxymuconolactone decarboxylase family protein YurZ